MKRIATQKNSFIKRFLINVPFVLMVVLMAAFFGGSALLIFYSIVTAVAFNSAMIYLIVAGAAAILLGAGLGFIILYKKYYAFYNKKMGWKFEKEEPPVKKEKTVTYENKSAAAIIKKYLTLSNVSIAILALGSVFAIISAALGSIDRANWVKEVGGYRQNKGYYEDVRYEIVSSFSVTDDLFIDVNGNTSVLKAVDTINVVLPEDGRDKEIVVIYTKDPSRRNVISIEGYKKFDGDFNCSRSGNVATIDIGVAPPLGDTLDNLLFFVFDDYYVEKQILIYVPSTYRDKLEISKVDRIVEE